MIRLVLEKRSHITKFREFGLTFLSILIAVIIGGIFIASKGVNPFVAYAQIFIRVIGSSYGLSESLVKMIPLIFTGISVAMALENKVWNIGAEGQFLMGAFFVTAFVLYAPAMNHALYLILMILIGFVGGALWSLIPALLKIKYSVNEVITTLLMNYIALGIVQYFVFGIWKGPDNFPKTIEFPEYARLAQIGFGRLHTGVILALIVMILFYVIMKYTTFGYRVRIVGASSRAGEYAGMNVGLISFFVFLISGGLAGLAGMNDLCGIQYRLHHAFSVGYGYTGIIVAWLSKSNPFVIAFFAFFLSVIITGSEIIQISLGLPGSIGIILQSLILFCILGAELFKNYKLKFYKD